MFKRWCEWGINLPSFIFGENRVLKHPCHLPQVPCFLIFFHVCATLKQSRKGVYKGAVLASSPEQLERVS